MGAHIPPPRLFSGDGLRTQICLQLILSSDATIRHRRRAGPHQRMLLCTHGADPDPDLISLKRHAYPFSLLAIAACLAV